MPIYGVFSGPYFPVFGLNTEIYGVNLCIQSEYRKTRTRKNSVFGHFSRSVQTAATIQQNDIPKKILKENSAVVARYFHENINFCTENLILPSDLKVADVTPAVKKKFKTSKDNYIPINILPNISKIYERCLCNQIQTYFHEIVSKYQCGFHEGFNAQHCSVSMIGKWKESVDNGRVFSALMTDLSKAFDCLRF